MLYSHTKPVNLFASNLHYLKHKAHLENIETAPILLSTTNPIDSSFKKIHNRSVSYHHHELSSKINKENEKMVARLMQISHRKKKLLSGGGNQVRVQSYLSPSRKRREKRITEQNYNLAMKIINKRSQFDPQKIQKQIRDYEQLKKTLYHNKNTITTVNRTRTSMLTSLRPAYPIRNSSMKGPKERESRASQVTSAEKKARHMRVSSV